MNTGEYAMSADALKWAARTYVVAAIGSIGTLLYYLMIYMNRRWRSQHDGQVVAVPRPCSWFRCRSCPGSGRISGAGTAAAGPHGALAEAASPAVTGW